MSNKWYDEEGFAWDRACTYCCNRHERRGEYSTMLDYCKVLSKEQFTIFESSGMGNECPEFRTDDWVS